MLDDAAVLTCMSYVDLNPLRAGIAETPKASDFTSVQQRIRDIRVRPVSARKVPANVSETAIPTPPLLPLASANDDSHGHALGYTERDYLELVDWAGRAVRSGKKGAIPSAIPPILARLGLDPARYLHHMNGSGKLTHHLTALGSLDNLAALAQRLGRAFVKGNGVARQLYCGGVGA